MATDMAMGTATAMGNANRYSAIASSQSIYTTNDTTYDVTP